MPLKYIFSSRSLDIGCFFFLLGHKRRPNSPPDALPALCRKPRVGEQSVKGARQGIAMIITRRKCYKNRLERPAGPYLSSRKRNTLYNHWSWYSVIDWSMRKFTCNNSDDCVRKNACHKSCLALSFVTSFLVVYYIVKCTSGMLRRLPSVKVQVILFIVII